MRLILLLAGGLLGACVEPPAPPVASAPIDPPSQTAQPEPTRPVAVPAGADTVRTQPPERSVRMLADPAPPFTYWAPEGATIRNHGNPGIWIAYVQGRQVAMYFGDGCGASGLQPWVGMPVTEIPAPVQGEQRRVFAVDEPVTDDLRPDRLNVAYSRDTGRVVSVSCS